MKNKNCCASFGTAGNPEAFYDAGHKASLEMPSWLAGQGLDAYEYAAGRGVRIKDDTASAIADAAKTYDIKMSLHAPYFINFATAEKERMAKNSEYVMSSLNAARHLGADRVVLHAGGQGKDSRSKAMEQTKKGLAKVVEEASKTGYDDIFLLPETMGKKGQMGTLEEVVELCLIDVKRIIPAVDFGHLYAVTGGLYVEKDDYRRAFDYIGGKLGAEVLQSLHVHFSCIEFTKAGEKKHWTFADEYGPPFEPFIDTVIEYGLAPRVICESAGTQDVDASTMRMYYLEMKK